MQALIDEAKDKNKSLATFKPSKITDFTIEKCQNEYDPKKLEKIIADRNQLNLFEEKSDFEIVQKLPYKFSYKFQDEEGKESKLMIEDWEVGALYWNCLKNGNDEKKALEKVKNKYKNFIINNDLYFFLGTTLAHHKRSRNPFIIIGLFYPTIDKQIPLF